MRKVVILDKRHQQETIVPYCHHGKLYSVSLQLEQSDLILFHLTQNAEDLDKINICLFGAMQRKVITINTLHDKIALI